MLEFERNSPIETGVLAEFFARCGWQESEAPAKIEWVLAGSEEWVTCKLDGELVGFGRSSRLGPVKRVVFDVLVDTRLEHSGLRREIVRLLVEHAGSLEEVSIFSERRASVGAPPLMPSDDFRGPRIPQAPPDAYLGQATHPEEERFD